MAAEIIFLVEESPEGGFEAKALGHSIYPEAETLEELKQATWDAAIGNPAKRNTNFQETRNWGMMG